MQVIAFIEVNKLMKKYEEDDGQINRNNILLTK